MGRLGAGGGTGVTAPLNQPQQHGEAPGTAAAPARPRNQPDGTAMESQKVKLIGNARAGGQGGEVTRLIYFPR